MRFRPLMWIVVFFLCAGTVLVCSAVSSARSAVSPTESTVALIASSIEPPAQPRSGPGGSQYAHASVEEHTYGEGDTQYWLFEPANPKPASAPVVIFNHGWGAMNPSPYRGWIDHIVRRGNIVIYPRYQGTLRTKPDLFLGNAITSVKDALKRLTDEAGHVRPQLDKLAVVGHSAGGQISAGMAARAASAGLPPMRAVMCAEPGKSWGPTKMPLGDMNAMPASTLLLAIVGDRDNVVKDIDGKRIINETVHVPAQNKNLIKMVSDDHGSPGLVANHFAPTAPGADSSSGHAFGSRLSAGQQGGGGPIRQLIRERMRQRFQQTANAGNNSSPKLPESEELATSNADEPSSSGAPQVTEWNKENSGDSAVNATDPGAEKSTIRATIGLTAPALQGDQPLLDADANKSMRGINALDYYCTWKLFDALEDAAFYGKNRDYALGNTPKQRYMGKWSDGVPVKELVVQVGGAK